ncbi:MAG: MFS transporter [Ruminococcaceae bacterium]|nr:MFS transporter [Oscillospiraceae bacterium]
MKNNSTYKKLTRREKEILKWEKERRKPKRNLYFVYLVLIISLIYATDEIASQIGTLMKTEIANDLFAKFGESSVGVLDILSMIVVPFQALGLIYRPLADKLGRKLFLIINTFGMSVAMLVIFLSGNLYLYFAGACLVQFFIPHDMHVVYIMESSPSKHRARIYSVIKFFANMSVMLIPLLRKLLMKDASQWRMVFFIPAVVGIITSLIALLTARETDTFIESRLKYLRKTEDEIKAERRAENAQGGLIPALKFALKHKQLRWLYITAAFTNIGFIATLNYQVVLSYGYAQNFVQNGLFKNLGEEVMNAVSTGPVTTALFMFPVGSAIAQVIMGFISDSKGRKTAAVVTAFDCLLSFILFTVGARLAWEPYLVGFFCGAFIGSYYTTNDVLIMMIGESSPTNLRSSTMSAQFIVTALGVVISYGVSLPLVTILGNTFMGVVCFGLLVPGFIIALFLLAKKTHETKGINMDTVTGCEWD